MASEGNLFSQSVQTQRHHLTTHNLNPTPESYKIKIRHTPTQEQDPDMYEVVEHDDCRRLFSSEGTKLFPSLFQRPDGSRVRCVLRG